MTAYKHYFIVGTDDLALHDTMNGTVTGELIRCKDCRHYTGEWCTIYSTKKIDINDIYKDADDFCSQAEREEE